MGLLMRSREVTCCNEFSSWRGRSGLRTGAAPSMGSRGEMGFPERTGTTAQPVWRSHPQQRQGTHSLGLRPPRFCKQLRKERRAAHGRLARAALRALTQPARHTERSACNRGRSQPFAGQRVPVEQFGSKGSASSIDIRDARREG